MVREDGIFVVGDVHGCFYTLQKLLKKLPQDARVIFVGDLVDKGNYSKEVVEFVKLNNYESIIILLTPLYYNSPL